MARKTAPSLFKDDHFWALALVVMVVVAYLPVFSAGYIWDDDTMLTGNPCIAGPLGLKEIWTSEQADICPFMLTTFWVEHKLWGMAPMPYHLVNVLMHAGNAVLLWQILRRLKVPAAWAGAALWALHPVQVESVAWVTEMKNTESGLFFLLSILFFLRGLKNETRWNYAWTLLFAALAMVSKSSTVILPVILLLLAWWMENRWDWRWIIKVAPVFVLSITAGLVSVVIQHLEATQDSYWARSWPQRFIAAGEAVWFYLGKLIWPYPLSMVYRRWHIDGAQAVAYLPLLAVIIVSAVLWLKRRTWARPYFFAWAYFLIALFPGLGFADMTFMRHSLVADHLQYLADMAPLALAAAALAALPLALPEPRWLPAGIAALVLTVLGVVTWQRTWVYQDQAALWADTLAKNPNTWAGYSNYGYVALTKGQLDQAVVDFRKAIAINPHYAEAYNNMGVAFGQSNRLDEAIEAIHHALALEPEYYDAHNNLGNVLAEKGDAKGAIEQFQEATKIEPWNAIAYYNLGNVLSTQGKAAEATAAYQTAIKTDPHEFPAYNALGKIFLERGMIEQAINLFRQVLTFNPGNGDAHCGLGVCLMRTGQDDQAMGEFQQALETDPNNVAAHNNLGVILAKKGQNAQAAQEFQAVLRLNPNFTGNQQNLSKLRAAAGRTGP